MHVIMLTMDDCVVERTLSPAHNYMSIWLRSASLLDRPAPYVIGTSIQPNKIGSGSMLIKSRKPALGGHKLWISLL
jgi:hypothetical protein